MQTTISTIGLPANIIEKANFNPLKYRVKLGQPRSPPEIEKRSKRIAQQEVLPQQRYHLHLHIKSDLGQT